MSDWLDFKDAAARLIASERVIKYLVATRKVQSQLVPQPGTKPKRFILAADIDRIKEEKNGTNPVVMSDSGEISPKEDFVEKYVQRKVSDSPVVRSSEMPVALANLIAGGSIPVALQEDQWDRLEKLLTATRPSMDVLTPGEAAIYSKRSEGALAKLRKEGKLHNVGSPGRILYATSQLDELLRIGRTPEITSSDCVDSSDLEKAQ